jgi:hypothetical protein
MQTSIVGTLNQPELVRQHAFMGPFCQILLLIFKRAKRESTSQIYWNIAGKTEHTKARETWTIPYLKP